MDGAASPWPRFRGNPQQTGRVPAIVQRHVPGWRYPPAERSAPYGKAARGIFNSAVVGADGSIWSGDASGRVSRLTSAGAPVPGFVFRTHKLIDTTPLLHDGNFYIACGDGWIWRLAQGESQLWQWFEAPRGDGFINWFEGHLAVDGTGNIVAPNDNFHVYVIDPATRQVVRDFQMHDQTWSLPCLDPRNGTLFFGNNAMKELNPGAANVYVEPAAGAQPPTPYVTLGSVVASPAWHDGVFYVGSFDGNLYAFEVLDQAIHVKWWFTTRDHLYSSPAILSDGTVVQAGCDGSVYGLHPKDGTLLWRHDSDPPNPFRSSPAVDPWDRTWIGTGDGHVLVLDKSGRQLARIPLQIDGPRKAVNASPAISDAGIVIGDSEGALHLVPWLHASEAEAAPRQSRLAAGAEPTAFLRRTDVWGVTRQPLPARPAFSSFTLRPGEPLCFTLEALRRTEQGDEPMAGLLQHVDAAPAHLWDVTLSGDRRYVIVAPKDGVQLGVAHPLTLRAEWTHGPERLGLRMRGGQRGADMHAQAQVTFQPQGPSKDQPPEMLWYQRVTMSLPGLMPSYNQIGFETLLYGITRVCQLPNREWLYLVTGWQSDGTPDPATKVRFLLRGRWSAPVGCLQLRERNIYSELNGFDTRMESFAITGWFDANHRSAADPVLRLSYKPSAIGFYGGMLEALGMGDEANPIEVLGSGELATAAAPRPGSLAASWSLGTTGEIRVRCDLLQDPDKVMLALAIVSPAGEPVVVDYAGLTSRAKASDGSVELILRPPKPGAWTPQHQVWLVANGVPLQVPLR